MIWVFWTAVAVVLYTYIGYLFLLYLSSLVRRLPWRKDEFLGPVSFVIAARNEGASIADKLTNLRQLDYPEHLIEVVIVSDGSTDETNQIIKNDSRVKAVILETSGGKAAALNAGVEVASH